MKKGKYFFNLEVYSNLEATKQISLKNIPLELLSDTIKNIKKKYR